MKGACETPVMSLNGPRSVPGVDHSDHMSYWEQGFPAVLITDSAFYRNGHYHSDEDQPATLDYAKMSDVVKGIYAVATTF